MKKIRKEWVTALHEAAFCGQLDVATRLLEEGVDIDARIVDGSTPLILAAEAGHYDLVKLLRRKGASLTASDQNKHTPFTAALAGGHVDIAKYLLKEGSDINHRIEPLSLTPCMLVAQIVKPELVDLLVGSGADIRAQDDRGRTALHYAVIGGIARVTKTTWDNGKETVVEDKPQDAVAIIELLMAAGADPNVRDKDGMTPLNWARKAPIKEITELLQ